MRQEINYNLGRIGNTTNIDIILDDHGIQINLNPDSCSHRINIYEDNGKITLTVTDHSSLKIILKQVLVQ